MAILKACHLPEILVIGTHAVSNGERPAKLWKVTEYLEVDESRRITSVYLMWFRVARSNGFSRDQEGRW